MKVLIVDDELVICEGIRRRIGQCFGRDVTIQICIDSERALSLIMEWEPEIVLIDICMPKMDGIELIQNVYQKGAEPYFIVISGYDDFRYARSALKLGVVDYLLKPIDEQELYQSVKKLIEKKMKKIVQEKGKYGPDQFHRYLKQGIRQGFSSVQKPGCAAIDFKEIFPYEYYRVVVFPGYIINMNCFEYMPVAFSDHHNRGIFCVLEERNGVCCCIISENVPDRKLAEEFWKGLQKLPVYAEADCTTGISRIKHNMEEIKTAFREALTGCYLHMYGKRGLIYFEEESFCPITMFHANTYLEQLKRALLAGEGEKINYIIYQMFEAAGTKNVNPMEFANSVKYMMLHLAEFVSRLDNKTEPKATSAVLEQFDFLCREGSASDIVNYVRETIRSLRHTESGEEKVYSYIVRKIIKYVHSNINVPITIKSLSETMEKSQNYLGSIFKKETGINFNSYVTMQKMIFTKELIMKEPDIRIYELADKVGYQDVKYFTRLFKQYYGMTPGQMKNSLSPYYMEQL